jgi:serine protease inhibitor
LQGIAREEIMKHLTLKRTAKRTLSTMALLSAIAAMPASAAAQAAQPHSAPAPAWDISVSANDFGLRLLRTLTDGTGGNVIISPLSVSLALAMTYNGAAGDTKAAMAKTIGATAFSDDDFYNQANRNLLDILKRGAGAVEMEIANALWAQSGFPIEAKFLKVNQDFFDAPVESLDFEKAPKESADAINAWVSKNTRGKIPEIITTPEPLTRLILTDAVYFKGTWTVCFDKKATEPRTFHRQDGGSVKTPMMIQKGEYQYFETDAFQAIRLPYGDQQQFAMYVFLPREPNGLPAFIRSLDEQHWREWTANLAGREGKIVLPRFESNYGKSLNDALKAMGMGMAFGEGADFSLINPRRKLYISDVEHKTYVKVDEEGTEAAAATAAGMADGIEEAPPPPPFEMIVDHPFFLAIADRESGAILFAGIVTNPAQQ